MTTENNEAPSQIKNPMEITHLDTDLLVRFVTDTGKILPSKYTGLTAKQQRHITKTIKRARNLLLMK